jgi:hypothetical protein
VVTRRGAGQPVSVLSYVLRGQLSCASLIGSTRQEGTGSGGSASGIDTRANGKRVRLAGVGVAIVKVAVLVRMGPGARRALLVRRSMQMTSLAHLPSQRILVCFFFWVAKVQGSPEWTHDDAEKRTRRGKGGMPGCLIKCDGVLTGLTEPMS